jgi:hypothetical protein
VEEEVGCAFVAVLDGVRRARLVEDVRVDVVVGRGCAREVDADRAIEDGEDPPAVKRARVAEDGRKVLVGELHHVGRLVITDARALRIQGVIVAAVQILSSERQLVEAERELLRREDEPPVAHEDRQPLHIEEVGELM